MNEGSEKHYWEERWKEGRTGWDMGSVSPPLQHYVDQLTDHDLRILIPGCGNAYEGEYLWERGFRNTYLMDISPTALASFNERVPDFPADHLLETDFFAHEGRYDLILEQTFFCAIDPSLRKAYAQHVARMLVQGGKLVGVLWAQEMNVDSPPYGGSLEEYRELFSPYFDIEVAELAHNSIEPRAQRELFVILRKP